MRIQRERLVVRDLQRLQTLLDNLETFSDFIILIPHSIHQFGNLFLARSSLIFNIFFEAAMDGSELEPHAFDLCPGGFITHGVKVT